jgi:hypothetical protein
MVDLNGARIAILIPPPIEGSGGIGEIFNRAHALCRVGAKVDFYFKDFTSFSNAEALLQTIAYYGEHDFGVYPQPILQHRYDLAMATAWDSVPIVVRQQIPAKLYMIQDYEAYFNPMGDGFVLGTLSYARGLVPLTLGNWLAWRLHAEFGLNSFIMPWAADLSMYKKESEMAHEDALCFVYQPEKPRRCQYIGLEALRLVKEQRPQTTIYVFGTREAPPQTFDFKFLGLLTKPELRHLYNKCRLGFVISGTNPSRIPFEMMACGLPVVDIYLQNNLFDYPGRAVNLSYPSPPSLAAKMIELMEDDETLTEQSNYALAYMAARPIEIEHAALIEAVKATIEGRASKVEVDLIRPLYKCRPFIADDERSAAADYFMRHQLPSAQAEMTTIYLVPGHRERPFGDVRQLNLHETKLIAPNEDFGFPLLLVRPNGAIRLHPVEGNRSTIGLLNRTVPPGTTQIDARVTIEHEQSEPVSFAMVMVARSSNREASVVSAKVLEECEWTTVTAGQVANVQVHLPHPNDKWCDLILATRMDAPDVSNSYAWAIWQEVTVNVSADVFDEMK